ncbi:NAD(P)/FAD-dependent oxidoreductase [Mycobacterium sp. 236(2023)]|uniref:NAD(P)/FAD-dependent oxidoreductase n=1 Tax=Mycobacterium sp. 236(2023) TaxID=3038163 RepID=UPI00241520A1|nr:NAD(P)/FAD-dependent oxidoreductase [Mycobacterium sp. 236(2023)]MDG4664244.1 NAD(P)/FAD-dependent oxidoreductase [Mycobacterium sp. 236(2023)]
MAAKNPLIIGAGPAGLTAALDLVGRGVTPRIYEGSSHVGGLARTPTVGDWRVDPGGHRFFTRHEEILDLWKSLLPHDQWIAVPRSSAMFVENHLVPYPLRGRDLLKQLGFRSGVRGLGSITRSRIRRSWRVIDKPQSFREWGIEEFGRHWYQLFFDGYVRKTWLADPDHLASDWANQRIKPIDWRHARERDADQDVFRYPRLGPGQLWDAAAASLEARGVAPSLNSPVVSICDEGDGWTIEMKDGRTASGDAVFSSMPLQLLVNMLEPRPPKYVRAIASSLRHRSVITVAVALRKQYDMPFNWVYTPGPEFRVGRIQNYGRWSPDLAPEGFTGTHLGLEYFTLPHDDLWIAGDESLGDIVEQDLRALGFDASDLEHVMIVRSQYAYPIYDPGRERNVVRIRDYLRQNHPTLHPIGRNGMHRYDNQDHAMLSALRSVARYFGENADPWLVNTDLGYHESGLLRS